MYSTENHDLHVRAFQIHVDSYRLKSNFDKIRKNFVESPAHLNLFPEASTSGFPYRRLKETSVANLEFLTEMQSLAAELKKGLILPMLVENGENTENFVNRQHVIGPDGSILDTYDKIHLIGVMAEDRFLKAGGRVVSVPYPHPAGEEPIRLGLATCYDLRFPELFRTLTLQKGAELFLLPAMWPVERTHHFQILIPARALENQTAILACNSVGQTGLIHVCGGSMIVNPRGEILHRASVDLEEHLDLFWNRADTQEFREGFPVLKDARLFRPTE